MKLKLDFLTKRKVLITAIALSIFVSCTENEVETVSESESSSTLSDEQLLQKKKMIEIAKVVGELVTSNNNILTEISSSMNKMYDPNLDAISFSSLLGNSSNAKKIERSFAKGKDDLVSKSLIRELSITKAKHRFEILNNKDFQLFFPLEKMHSEQGNLSRITVSYAPLGGGNYNKGFIYENGKLVDKILKVDHNYVLANPTLVILPIDNNLDTLLEKQYKKEKNRAKQRAQRRVNEITENLPIDDEWQQSIISTMIPEIRLSWGEHIDMFSLGSRIILATGGSDYDTPRPSPITQVRPPHFVSFWDVMFRNWVPYYQDFDNDWTRLEREVEFVAASKHLFIFQDVNVDFDVSATAVCDASFNISLDDLLNGNFELPSLNCTVNGGLREIRLSGRIAIDNSKFHANKKMLREQVIGSNFGGIGYGTRNVNGNSYSIRKLGNIEFYLRNYEIK
ncbi:hypothetical protein [Tenacibaculum sp. C7A-26P2]|uniref:hypothetical protein n=1 Tax=Tenacibaculum sp. C7A-26P2 TaxID=3447504 RepID=UPI003F87547F